jgi:DnaJ-domain-containing protein 1
VELTAAERQMGPLHGGPVNLARANLQDTNLNNALLSGADFTAANLTRADFAQARLDAANFYHANLAGATFDHADLAGADLTGAWIGGARLQDARNLTQEQIDRASGDASTTLPPGLHRPSHWKAGAEDSVTAPDDQEDPYAILGLPRDATAEQVRRAYHKLAKAYHPDRADARGAARFHAITEAARLLRDPDRRLLYDRGDIDFAGRLTSAGHSRHRKLRNARVYIYAAAALVVAAGVGVFASLRLEQETPEPARDVKIAERAGAARIAAEPAAQRTESTTHESRLAVATGEEAPQARQAPVVEQAETPRDALDRDTASGVSIPPSPVRHAGASRDVEETASITLQGQSNLVVAPALVPPPAALPASRPSFASAYFGGLRVRAPELQVSESAPPLPESRGSALSRQTPQVAGTIESLELRPAATPADVAAETRSRSAVAISFAPARLDDWPRKCVLTPDCKANEAWCTC